MLGHVGAARHFEFKCYGAHAVLPTLTAENLVVLYLPDAVVWAAACKSMLVAGFKPVGSFNPYWDERGCTYEDPDDYRTVLERAGWNPSDSSSDD